MAGFIDVSLALVSDPVGLLVFACAVVAGLVSGIIPGLGTMAFAVVVLPLTVAMPLTYTMTIYGALFISGVVGRHLARAGDAGRATLTNLTDSTVPGSTVLRVVLGGVTAAMIAVLLTEGAAGYVFFGFKTPEMFGLVFLALAAVTGAASRYGAKGWLALFLGLLLGLSVVGPVSDAPRYILGNLDILTEITFVPLLVGIVVVPDAIDAATRQVPLSHSQTADHAILSAMGTNAALLPLAAVGLPLSGGAVVIIAAAGLQGIELGPLFIIEAEEAARALLASAVWASVLAPLLANLVASRSMIWRKIPGSVVGSVLLVLAVAGVYALDAQLRDVYVMLACGLAGYLLRLQGYPLAFIILGMVLTQIGDPAFANAVSLLDGGVLEMLQRPVSVGLIAGGLLVMATVALWKVGPSSTLGGEETDNHEDD